MEEPEFEPQPGATKETRRAVSAAVECFIAPKQSAGRRVVQREERDGQRAPKSTQCWHNEVARCRRPTALNIDDDERSVVRSVAERGEGDDEIPGGGIRAHVTMVRIRTFDLQEHQVFGCACLDGRAPSAMVRRTAR